MNIRILIDNQSTVDVDATTRADEDGDEHVIIDGLAVCEILERWKSLAIGQRNYRVSGGESVGVNESEFFVAWVSGHNLVMDELNRFWDGRTEEGFSLTFMAEQLFPGDMLQWSELS